MTDRIILRNDSSFTISEIMPSDWDKADISIDVSVTDLNNNVIIDDAAATVYAGDVVNGAAVYGQREIILTTGNAVVAGQVLIIGSDATGFHEMTVDDYTAATKTIAFTEFLPEDIPDLAKVYGRDMTYALDASVAAFATIKKVSVEWIPDTDDVPNINQWQVLDRDSRIGGLESHFIQRFKKYKELIGENWSTFENDAWVKIKMIFKSDGRNIDTLVVNHDLEPLMMRQIALLCCDGNPAQYKEDIIVHTEGFTDELAIIRSLSIWDDSNQDKIQTESEVQPAMQPGMKRGL